MILHRSALFATLTLLAFAGSATAQISTSGSGCTGQGLGAPATMTPSSGPAQVGTNVTFGVTNGQPSAPAVLLLGLSIGWTPVDLAVLGMPGCSLLLDAGPAVPLTLDIGGGTSITGTLLNDPTTVGSQLDLQFFIADPVNAFGFITSDLMTITIQA